MKEIQLACFVLIFFCSCNFNKNKLNSSEQKLAAEIKAEEQAKLDQEGLIQNQPTIPDTLPPGFRFQENRKIDSTHPPQIIDIAGLHNTKKDFKLSELVNEIKYIPLDEIPETNYAESAGYTVFLAENQILIKCLYGLYLFNRDGTYKDVVCENKGDRIESFKKNVNKSTTATPSGFLKGIFLGNIWTIDNKLFYRYVDNETKKHFLMSFDMASSNNGIPLPSSTEEYQITGKGEILTSLGVEKGKMFSEYAPTSKESFVGIMSKTKSAMNGELMTSFRLNGDTLSTFTDFETISNFGHTIMRGNYPQISYQFGQTFTFLNAFNDTVFRILPPNRFLPAYILNMGKFKIITQEGLAPGDDISSKLYVSEFFETKTHIFLKIKQGYDSPGDRIKKSLAIFHAIYDKEKKQLSLLPIDPKGYYKIENGNKITNNPQGITNDIDGGLLFWPKNVSPKGEVYEMVTGEKLKNHVLSEEFTKSMAPKTKKEELKKITERVRDDQLVLIIYK